MAGKKASKLRFFWIALMSGIFTLWGCSKVLLGSPFAKNFREFIDQTMLKWAERLVALIKVRLKVVGIENMPPQGERPIIVMCNHSSLYDIPISAIALKTSLRMLTKKELFKIPIFGAALRKGEYISIDRHNREQSLKDLENAKQKMLSGIVLWIAPEGTRSKNGLLAEFKRGGFHIALDADALIVPLVIKDIHKVQAGDDLTLYLDQEIEVELCEPVDAAEYSVERRRELVQEVRTRMLEKLNQN